MRLHAPEDGDTKYQGDALRAGLRWRAVEASAAPRQLRGGGAQIFALAWPALDAEKHVPPVATSAPICTTRTLGEEPSATAAGTASCPPAIGWPNTTFCRNVRHRATTRWFHEELGENWEIVAQYLGNKLTTDLNHDVPRRDVLHESSSKARRAATL